MDREIVATPNAPAAIGPYSQAVCAGSWIFVSGQLGLNPKTGELASPGLPSQARQALENLRSILEAAGSGLRDVVSVDVFMTDIGHFGLFNQIYEEVFGEHRPARAVIGVNALPRGAFVEIRCIAVRRETR